jgi:hypothetical protein
MAASPVEIRMSHLEGAFDQMDKRLSAVEREVHDFRAEVHGDFRDLRAEMRGQFRWILGLLVVAILSPAILRLLGH